MEEVETAASSFPMATAIAVGVLTVVLFCLRCYFIREDEEPAARVTELNIYPIKSCAEFSVKSAVATHRGFEDDRAFQVVTEDAEGKLELCTARDRRYEKLFHLKPHLTLGRRLKMDSVHADKQFTLDFVRSQPRPTPCPTMGHETWKLDDYGDKAAEWISKAADIPKARLVGIPVDRSSGDGTWEHYDETEYDYNREVSVNPDQGDELPPSNMEGEGHPVSLGDEAPYLLCTTESLDDLNARMKANGKDPVDMRRFRPNIVISGLQPWEEDSLKRVRIGDVQFHVWQRAGRCTMTTIDRDSLERCGEPLNSLNQFRERDGQRNFGMHLIPAFGHLSRGDRFVRVGSDVEILEYDKERRAEWVEKFGNNGAAALG